jgi:hypothetical protein
MVGTAGTPAVQWPVQDEQQLSAVAATAWQLQRSVVVL